MICLDCVSGGQAAFTSKERVLWLIWAPRPRRSSTSRRPARDYGGSRRIWSGTACSSRARPPRLPPSRPGRPAAECFVQDLAATPATAGQRWLSHVAS